MVFVPSSAERRRADRTGGRDRAAWPDVAVAASVSSANPEIFLTVPAPRWLFNRERTTAAPGPRGGFGSGCR